MPCQSLIGNAQHVHQIDENKVVSDDKLLDALDHWKPSSHQMSKCILLANLTVGNSLPLTIPYANY